MNPPPLNQIIFGPPGTGKTYITVTKALEILDPQFLQDLRTQKLPEQSQRQQMKQRFDALYTQGRVLFTTFHQSFSYEDFVEGIRAVNDEETKQLNYPVVDGVFKTLCNKAATHGKTPSNSSYFPFYVNQNIGTGYTVLRISEDLVELRKPSHPNKVLPLPRSIIEKLIDYALQGKITEDDVRKKLVFERIPDAPLEKFLVNGYENVLAAMVEIAMNGDATEPPVDAPTNNAHVLVIDEINRGNVSRIFGELITLIEPSKRAGATEALTVTLPYSKQPFSVPSNVYIIGTMNTTDRSLAGLDVALRRRFAFEELMPDADLLKDAWVRDAVHSVNIGEMLTVMNERIEALLDREHQLGHAFFMPLMEKDKATLPTLANIFRQSVLPLLQEYFFDDWGRIAWVLNDHRKSQELRFVQEHGTPLDELFGKEAADLNPRKRWRLNSDAFDNLGSFAGIVQVQTDATAV